MPDSPVPKPTPIAMPELEAGEIRLDIPADSRYLGVAAGFIQSTARLAGFDEENAEAIEIAVMEAVENVIDHARVGHHDTVTVGVAPWGEEFTIEVRDRGVPWPERVLNGEIGQEMPPADSERGRGLAMMRALMDQVIPLQEASGAKALRLVKRLARVEAGS